MRASAVDVDVIHCLWVYVLLSVRVCLNCAGASVHRSCVFYRSPSSQHATYRTYLARDGTPIPVSVINSTLHSQQHARTINITILAFSMCNSTLVCWCEQPTAAVVHGEVKVKVVRKTV